MTEKMRVSIDVNVTELNIPPSDVLQEFVYFAALALDRAQRELDTYSIQHHQSVPYVVETDELEVYESIPYMFCAECGKGEDEIKTFVVTTLDYTDIKNTRTEVCVPCYKVIEEGNTT